MISGAKVVGSAKLTGCKELSISDDQALLLS
jgi:hypothetical protein